MSSQLGPPISWISTIRARRARGGGSGLQPQVLGILVLVIILGACIGILHHGFLTRENLQRSDVRSQHDVHDRLGPDGGPRERRHGPVGRRNWGPRRSHCRMGPGRGWLSRPSCGRVGCCSRRGVWVYQRLADRPTRVQRRYGFPGDACLRNVLCRGHTRPYGRDPLL